MKKLSGIIFATAFLVGCGGADETPTSEEAAAATEAEVAEPECDPATDPDCDHTGTVNVPPDRF